MNIFFKLFVVIFANLFLYSINFDIKTKYILLELKAPWPTSAISETYNRGHIILELVDILPNVSFTTIKTECDYYWKNCKYDLTDELPNNVRLKKISKLHRTIV